MTMTVFFGGINNSEEEAEAAAGCFLYFFNLCIKTAQLLKTKLSLCLFKGAIVKLF